MVCTFAATSVIAPSETSVPDVPCENDIDAAIGLLAHGGVVVYPTETLYGLGVDASNAAALHRLVQLKGREPGKPIAVLVADLGMVAHLAASIPVAAQRLMQRFWPGPLTVVLPARGDVAAVLTGGSGTIGVRLSSHPTATALVRGLGRPLTTPSANPAAAAPPRSLDVARRYFGTRVDAYLDGGLLTGEPPSTVVRVDRDLQIVRQGAIAAAAIREVWEGN